MRTYVRFITIPSNQLAIAKYFVGGHQQESSRGHQQRGGFQQTQVMIKPNRSCFCNVVIVIPLFLLLLTVAAVTANGFRLRWKARLFTTILFNSYVYWAYWLCDNKITNDPPPPPSSASSRFTKRQMNSRCCLLR